MTEEPMPRPRSRTSPTAKTRAAPKAATTPEAATTPKAAKTPRVAKAPTVAKKPVVATESKVTTTAAPTSPERRPGLPSRRRRVAPGSAPDASPETSEAQQRQAREALALARRIVDLAADKKAAEIVLLSVGALTTLTDYFVICSGGSERQLGGIADGIIESLKADGVLPIGREGAPDAHWVLIDYGSVIVHVMAWPERDFYGLEKLWSEAPLLLRVQ